jgi:NAD(P)-dependent dehydrogenase (short-subunit alcohol dehydrogenase family)
VSGRHDRHTGLRRPEQLARAALYLASDSSAFVTGTASLFDGGLSIARV